MCYIYKTIIFNQNLGSDKNHFCKPAGVVVFKIDGSIYVADGYCNNRVKWNK